MKQEQIRALLVSSVEAVDYIQSVPDSGWDAPEIRELLDHLCQAAVLIEAEMRDGTGILRQVRLYCRNVQASIDTLRHNPECRGRIMTCEVRPFILESARIWTYAIDVLSDAKRRLDHLHRRMGQMKALHTAPRESYKYDVSIVLCGYNKLEYTRAAIESIFAYTDFSMGRVELITVNNGSEDGTRAYFESLPHTKKMNLNDNILGFNAAWHIAEGKYLVGFSNDVVATPHWLDHLIACMESDARIATAVPTCNESGISNMQGIPVPYPNSFEGMARMQEFAAAHNHLNPALWEDRSQLMPFLAIVRMDVYKLGLLDPIYTRGEFVDDDLSTLLRRTGWRQVLLKDTFLHHFGGVTLGAQRRKEPGNALDAMRRVYYEKWGVDAWDSRGIFFGVENVQQWHTFCDGEHVLMLEPRFGSFACDLRNEYRRRELTPHMTAAVFDARYLPDTGCLFDETMPAKSIDDVAAQSKHRYDIISAGCYLDELPLSDVIGALEQLYGLLTPGGMLLLYVRNPGSAYELVHLLDDGMRDLYSGVGEVKIFSSISYQQLLEALQAAPFLKHAQMRIHTISFEQDIPLVERAKPLLRLDGGAPSKAEQNLLMRMFFLGIFAPQG